MADFDFGASEDDYDEPCSDNNWKYQFDLKEEPDFFGEEDDSLNSEKPLSLPDSESELNKKRIIRWRVRGIMPQTTAFELSHCLTAKGHQVLRVRINTKDANKNPRWQSEDGMFDILNGSNNLFESEEGYFDFHNNPFFDKIFSSFPLYRHKTTIRTNNLRQALQARKQILQHEDAAFCNELEKMIDKVIYCHSLNEKIRSFMKVYDTQDSVISLITLGCDMHNTTELSQLKQKLLKEYDSEPKPPPKNKLKKYLLKKLRTTKSNPEGKPSKAKQGGEALLVGEILLWDSLANQIDRKNQRILFIDNLLEQMYVFVDYYKPNSFEEERLQPLLKLKLEKTNIEFRECKFGTFISKDGKKLFRSYFDVHDAMKLQQSSTGRVKNGKMFTFYSGEEKRSRKMEIVFDIGSSNLQFKCEFLYKYSNAVHIEDLAEETKVYFSLMVPPRFYAYYHEAEEYLGYLLNEKWERIDYFILKKILNQQTGEDEMDELEKMYCKTCNSEHSSRML